MNNLFNLHGDEQIYPALDLTRFALNLYVKQRAWDLVYRACKRLGLRYEFFC